MTREELLAHLAGLRQARVGQVRVPHKPLLLLWLFGKFAGTGSSAVSYQQVEEPVSQLINDFGPPVASAALARQRAAMPFVHLERELWDLRDATGQEIASDAPERRAWLLDRGATGRLRAPVERLLADPATLAAAARLLLDMHFTPVLAELICAAVDLDMPALDLAGSERVSRVVRLRPGAAGSWRRSCVPTPTSARCAALTGRSGITPSRSRRPTCAGTASRVLTRSRTRWPCARSITRCST
jgi:putative restriction endonuclease